MKPLLVDSRETNSGIPALLRSGGIPFEQTEMIAGDYLVSDIIVERKAVNDLALSVMQGRLFGQAEAVCATGHRPWLLIEGDMRQVRSQITEEALYGAISALAMYWDIRTMWTVDTRGTASLLGRLWRHANEGLGYEVPLRAAKPKPAPDGASAQYLIEGLPSVGPDTARKLLAHFGTARAVFAAEPAALRACKGIGPKTADAIATALDLMPREFRITRAPAAPQ